MTQPTDRPPHRLILVTGPAGAGRSTAIDVLEDLGLEVVDNLPLSLLPRLLDGAPPARPMAVGIDARNREFSTAAMIETIRGLSRRDDLVLEVVYLDCDDDTLLRRFSATRRRHPLAPEEAPEVGIARERDLLQAVRAEADVLIDTSELTPHQLRADLERLFAPDNAPGLAVTLCSFSYKRGLPRGADLVFDVRFLSNPYWEPALRELDGRDPAVAAHVAADPRFEPFFARLADLLLFTLPAFRDEGKTHLSVAVGCTGGQHRSVAVTELLANTLAGAGWRVSKRHRELARTALSGREGKPGTAA